MDDQRVNVVLLERILAQAGYGKVVRTTDPTQALAATTSSSPT